jgi:uncharacterized membrane protein
MNEMQAVMAHAVAAWATAFSNSAILRTLVDFVHIGGLLGAGGTAIVVDRATLRAARSDERTRAAHLSAMHASHRIVVSGLAAVIVSGLLLFAADTETFLYSRIFWVKMALLGLLLINGAILTRAGRDPAQARQDNWRVLRIGAIVSLALWFLTTLAGAALPNAG